MASINWPDLHPIFLLIVCAVIPNSAANQVNLFTYCSNTPTFAPDSQYETNLNILLVSLSSNAASNPNGFYSRSIGDGTNDTIYGLFLCRGDLNTNSCSDCVNTAASELPQKYCPDRAVAIIWYDGCMVRYSNESFFGRSEVTPGLYLMNAYNFTENSITMAHFVDVLGELMWNASSQAAIGGLDEKLSLVKHNYNSSVTLYTLAQCTPDLSQNDCLDCLTSAISRLPVSEGARVLLPSCNVRYETYPFFNNLDASPTGGISKLCTLGLSTSDCNECLTKAMVLLPSSNNGRVSLPDCIVQYNKPINNGIPNLSASPPVSPDSHITGGATKKVVAISMSISLSLFIIVFLGFCIWMRMPKNNPRKIPKFDIEEIRTVESLQFDLQTIKAATQNFSRDNKLGCGGFGQVYKGVLEEGEEIAVKRLSKGSEQGDVEFKTEVLLVAKLQHKNLVKLLGFCFESNEKILIYEYLQNSSLDKILFDSTKNPSLNWQMRFEIIVGIARGLMYLHEDSRLKIIHRDLKPSNILLDRSMTPKISDFGMARLFGVDQTQGDTKRIVGTYGYMAPEYAMTGHFSVKSDVYSFGAILLEIVSGQKNRFFGRPLFEEALLHRAWRLWNDRTALDLVDTTLRENYPREEVTKCIHISLLCIQENAVERPSMSTIVAALSGQSISLPMPKAPSFFGITSIATEMASPHYRALMARSEIEYHIRLDEQSSPCIYSGTEEITELIPR